MHDNNLAEQGSLTRLTLLLRFCASLWLKLDLDYATLQANGYGMGPIVCAKL
jgi:hypothetical protein